MIDIIFEDGFEDVSTPVLGCREGSIAMGRWRPERLYRRTGCSRLCKFSTGARRSRSKPSGRMCF